MSAVLSSSAQRRSNEVDSGLALAVGVPPCGALSTSTAEGVDRAQAVLGEDLVKAAPVVCPLGAIPSTRASVPNRRQRRCHTAITVQGQDHCAPLWNVAESFANILEELVFSFCACFVCGCSDRSSLGLVSWCVAAENVKVNVLAPRDADTDQSPQLPS
eukprot:2917710-Pyramimonas_sp.AAC.1